MAASGCKQISSWAAAITKGESFINIALGSWNETDGLTGERRGGSSIAEDQNGNPQRYSFSGDIASLAGPNSDGTTQSHFMGTDNPNIVIGFDSTGSHNVGLDNPLYPSDEENHSGATYHVGVGSGPQDAGQQTDHTYTGFAAGFAQQPGGGTPGFLYNTSANGLTVALKADDNTMTASMKLGDGLLQNPKYDFEFGGAGRSAFNDDNTFAAIEAPSGSSVSGKYLDSQFPFIHSFNDDAPDVQGYFVSADAIKANQVLFGSNEAGTPVHQAFCTDCAFLKWGAWGARTQYDLNGQPITNDVHLGWWIAGDVANKDQIPTTGSATYKGDAIGTVASNGKQYVATGDMNMNWSFRNRLGILAISNFDNKSFSGNMAAPGKAVQFSGIVAGSNVIGTAHGAFVGPTVLPG